jgi:hypothetical protein
MNLPPPNIPVATTDWKVADVQHLIVTILELIPAYTGSAWVEEGIGSSDGRKDGQHLSLLILGSESPKT